MASNRAISPVVRQLIDAVHASGLTYDQLQRRSGWSAASLSNWRLNKSSPILASVEDMARACGYELVLVPMRVDTDPEA